ncbi:hypothetical protein K1719_013604 [Acacia pycnantha]|nr:hypothetical protein K1719_013604 [Acacia pycnantha]
MLRIPLKILPGAFGPSILLRLPQVVYGFLLLMGGSREGSDNLHMRNVPRFANDNLANILAMAETVGVREVLPHIPDDVIFQFVNQLYTFTCFGWEHATCGPPCVKFT